MRRAVCFVEACGNWPMEACSATARAVSPLTKSTYIDTQLGPPSGDYVGSSPLEGLNPNMLALDPMCLTPVEHVDFILRELERARSRRFALYE